MIKKTKSFTILLLNVLDCAEEEKKIIFDGKTTHWNLEQIQNVIIPEIRELLSYANNGEIYFKYGKKQRLLESTYLITDSPNNLYLTDLGKSISDLQNFYNTL